MDDRAVESTGVEEDNQYREDETMARELKPERKVGEHDS